MSTALHHTTTPQLLTIDAEPISTMDRFYGLSWKEPEGILALVEGLKPTWTIQPDIEVMTQIARRKLNIPSDSPCDVEFLAEGGFNKVYVIRCNFDTEYIMRISLPVHPRLKTISERATIDYVRQHTHIPVPQVLHFNAMRDDEFGFEWMIQDRVPGSSLTDLWKDVSWLEKELLVRKIVVYLAQLFRHRFRLLGSIYATQDIQRLSEPDIPDAVLLGANHSTSSTDFCISEVVSIPFFYNDHWSVDVERGPYKHSQDWLAAKLQFVIHDADNMSDTEDSEDDDSHSPPLSPVDDLQNDDNWSDTNSDIDGSESVVSWEWEEDGNEPDPSSTTTTYDSESVPAMQARISRLQALLPQVFPSTVPESYVLHHQDLSTNNMLFSFKHTLSGIIDWECVHTVPLWLACQIPRFLRCRARTSLPPFEQEFENEWYVKAYYEGVEEYEKTQLRELFLEEMRRVCPEWIEVFEASTLKADFEFACLVATTRGTGSSMDEWLDAVEKGEEAFNLREDLGQC
jgi:aminoglycoside phosphotransferase (APT) family kinase protein